MNKHRHIWRLEYKGPQNPGESYTQECKVCKQTRIKTKPLEDEDT